MEDMFSVTILGSGSSGNAALVVCGTTRLLVDAGLSARQLCVRMVECGIDPGTLDGILLTHEHQDHFQGLPVLCKKFEVPIYCNSLTAEVLRHGALAQHRNWRIFSTGSDFSVGDVTIQTFSVPHDAADPVGFVLGYGTHSFGVLTDLGFATKLVQERIRLVHTLLIETNHDEQLLHADVRRPWAVKQRILSRHGHLSNKHAAEVIASALGHRLRRVILGHLSSDCNTPQLAVDTVSERLAREGCRDLEILAAERKCRSAPCEIGIESESVLPF